MALQGGIGFRIRKLSRLEKTENHLKSFWKCSKHNFSKQQHIQGDCFQRQTQGFILDQSFKFLAKENKTFRKIGVL